ncbi:MAG: hypothetical protein QOI63_1466 [Thermoplasmata archaeon]|nr:hypothetical protein [Thermoplasmata archaeon]
MTLSPRPLLLALLCVGAAFGSLPAAFAQVPAVAIVESHWGKDTAALPADAGPGDRAQVLTVTLQNNKGSDIANPTASFRASSNVLTPSTTAGGYATAVKLEAGKTWAARFTLDVASTAVVGTAYAFNVQVSGTDGAGAPVTDTLPGTITVTGRARLELATPTPVVPANTHATLHLTVTNAGSASATVRVAFATRGVALVTPADTVLLGDMAVGASKPVAVTVDTPDTTSSANLTATFSFVNTQGIAVTQAATLRFAVGGAASASLRVGLREQQLSIGRAGTLHFTVTNQGALDLTSITVAGRFAATGATSTAVAALNASDVQTIAVLPAGASASVQMSVLVSSAATGLASFTVTASGTDEDGTVTGSYDFAVALVGTVEFSVGAVTQTVDAAAGTVTIAGTFTNLGNTQAHNVYLELAGPAFGQTQPQYLGDVDANSATPFSASARLLNGTALPAAPGGGFQRGTFTGAPGGGGGFGNRTRGGGGFGGGRAGGAGGQQVRLMLSWNDDYGSVHAQAYNATAQLRQAAARASTSTGSAGTLGSIVSTVAASPLAWLAAAAGIGGLVYWRKRAGRRPDQPEP